MPPGLEPRIVDEAKYRPGKCLASGDTEGPFIDAGRWTRERDPYVQLSVRWVEEVARDLLGMVPKAEIDERYAGLEKKLMKQAEELGKLDQLVQAASGFEKALELNGLRNVVESSASYGLDEALDREVGGVAS